MSSATENSERLLEPDSELQPGVKEHQLLTAQQTALIDEYVDLIKKWNRVRSLVSKGDLNHLEERHINDSLMLDPFLKHSGCHLDIGSGAGFPGVPLAICRPDVRFVLIDRSKNKCRFLREVKFCLNLTNVEVQEQDIGQQESSTELYDTISIRAVTPPERAWSLARPFLRKHGSVLLHTRTRYSTEHQGFSQGVVHLCTQSIRGWITVVRDRSES